MLTCTRFVYNSILRWRTDAYYDCQEKIGYTQASARLTALKKEPDFVWLNDVSSVPLQQALRHQQAAFSHFFAGRAKYPTFRSKRHKQAATLTDAAFKYRDGKLFMAKSKAPLDMRWEWSGRSVVAIDPFFPSSKRCSGCGYTLPKMSLNVRSWICPECGANHDRDVNAAKNIKAVGLTALAHGATVNPKAA